MWVPLCGTSSDIQESIANTWRITLEVVAQYQGIENFRATCHNMWIQACRDPTKEWLQLRYCIKEEEVEMEIRDWKDDWKIPVITKEIPKGKEVEAGSSKTPAGDNVCTQEADTAGEAQSEADATEEGECSKEGCTDRKEGHCPGAGNTRKGGHIDTRNPFGQPLHKKQGHPNGRLYIQGVVQEGQGS
jgi:hypothetical protein